MADDEKGPRPDVLSPYFVVETPTEGGPGVYTDGQHKREPMRTLFAVAELTDVDKSTLWRSLGPQGLVIQALAVSFLNNPGMFEAIGAMMNLLSNIEERRTKK